MAIYEDKLIVATSDAHIVALDAKTGKVAWDHDDADWQKGWRYTGGPFVANGMIVQGMTGCGNGQPGGCFITGHDPKTGEEKWRFHTIAHQATRAATPGTACRWKAASAARPGFPAATIPTRTWCSTASASPIPGSPR